MKLSEALRQDVDPRLLATSEGRRLITKNDPLMFAAIYLPHKLRRQDGDEITLNDFHFDVLDYAKSWTRPLDIKNKQHDAFIAPRNSGKSTWIGHILPLWCGAHLHKRYMIMFSDSDTQSRSWLLNFKQELSTNEYLQTDYPDFCEPLRLNPRAKAFEDNANRTQRANGFVFQVAGADSGVLGANVNGRRPEVILFDDIEPSESNYSESEAKKRLNTVLTSLFYLNTAAIKAFIGTTTMPDSIIDQIRKVGEHEKDWREDHETYDRNEFMSSLDPAYRWVVENNIRCHYWPAILEDAEGSERSLWPEEWDYADLNNSRHLREFLMNMMNRPVSLEEGYWGEADVKVEELPVEEYGNTIISLDPAVKQKRRNDYTGITVASRRNDGKIQIRHNEHVKLSGEELRDRVEELIEEYGAGVLYVETNQGGDLWKQVFGGVKAKYREVHQTVNKSVRAAQAHSYYQKDYVRHSRNFPVLEEQMLAYPNVRHDDALDSCVSAVLYFQKPTGRVKVREYNYLEA